MTFEEMQELMFEGLFLLGTDGEKTDDEIERLRFWLETGFQADMKALKGE